MSKRIKSPSTVLTPQQRLERIETLRSQINQIQRNIASVQIPMSARAEEIRELLRNHEHVVIVGETGSGKSTILPLILLEQLKQEEIEHGYAGRIAVTQPRVIAATSVSRRVAEINKSQIGQEIGYLTGKDSSFDQENTDVCFLTEKIIINQFKNDPYLKDYSIVMVDEAHERSLNIDFLMGILKLANQKRKEIGMRPIRIIITSATIEKERFARYISDGKSENNHAQVSGRTFEVEKIFSDRIIPVEGYTRAIVQKTKDILASRDEGDILVFLPGKAEISEVESLLNSGLLPQELSSIEIHSLHSEISPEDQRAVFRKTGKRKLILATNIAETSITLEGVTHVIDSGFIKQSSFTNGIKVLRTVEHSQKGLIQRMGRAGRVKPGKAHLLYTEDEFRRRQEFTTPEIQRTDLSEVILTLISVGIKDINQFPFIDKPSTEEINRTILSLQELGAIDENKNLTPAGEFMIKIPAEPRTSRIIYEAVKLGEADRNKDPLRDTIIIAAFMQVSRNVFLRDSRSIDRSNINQGSDFVLLVNIFNEYLAAPDKRLFCEQRGLVFRTMQDVSRQRQDLLDTIRKGGVTISDSKGLNPYALETLLGRILASGASSSNIYVGSDLKNIHETYGPRTHIARESIVDSNDAVLSFNPSQAEVRGRTLRFLNMNHSISISDLTRYKPELFERSTPQISRDQYAGQSQIVTSIRVKATGLPLTGEKRIVFSELSKLEKSDALRFISVIINNTCEDNIYNSYLSQFCRDVLSITRIDNQLVQKFTEICYERQVTSTSEFIEYLKTTNDIAIIDLRTSRTLAFRDSDGTFRVHLTREQLQNLSETALKDRDGKSISLRISTDIPRLETLKVSGPLDIERIKNQLTQLDRLVEEAPQVVVPEEAREEEEAPQVVVPEEEATEEEAPQVIEPEKSSQELKNELLIADLHIRYQAIIKDLIAKIYEIDKSDLTQSSVKEIEIMIQNEFNDFAISGDYYSIEETYEMFVSELNDILSRVQKQAEALKQALEEAERQRAALEEAQRIESEAAEQKTIERERQARQQQSLSLNREDLEKGINGLARALGARVSNKRREN